MTTGQCFEPVRFWRICSTGLLIVPEQTIYQQGNGWLAEINHCVPMDVWHVPGITEASLLWLHSSSDTDVNMFAEMLRANPTAEFTIYFPAGTPFQHVLEHIGVALRAGVSHLSISHTRDNDVRASTTDLQIDLFEFAERVRIIYPNKGG